MLIQQIRHPQRRRSHTHSVNRASPTKPAPTSAVRGEASLGVGLVLIIDEAAPLITLKDMYWHTQGWISVAIAVVIISVLGTVLVITRSGREEDDPDRR
jgi:hypothetical protein